MSENVDPVRDELSEGRDDIADVRALLVPGQIPVAASDAGALQLGVIGRTEDVAVSPDGSRLVIAGFNANVLAVAEFDVTSTDRVHASIGRVDLLRAPDLARPHGVIWLDDTTLVVANRESELLLIDVTAPSDHRAAVIGTRVLVDGTSPVPVHSPGSVAARWITADLVEMIVCNNYAHDVTRYIVDRSDDWKVVDAGPSARRVAGDS